ncbi:calcium/calmodulin-dependent 3',5'-cyclic nucleotide phosphodiesterase 1A-like [Varanus komodoensis]|uniref:calcium/calmodulin-dependent 3',5'-cyclic nucleotide phosphodiesterase 1A-like n=1 Tax=Varanus komodoensis TaxID=61221 RepID=UPI001CF78869|nr:calcium/calmodulin-dependent 3',5'-cyclic nucleotide phosphodiesterase 1A-like [Varanus komodoensis]
MGLQGWQSPLCWGMGLSRSLLDTEDELCNIQWDSMPVDVREWLTGTFAKKKNPYRNNLEETASVRAISYTVHTGVSVERKFRANTSSVGMAYSLEVVQAFKDVDNWDFNVFTLNEASGGHGLTCIMCELFSKYDLLSHFKIPLTCLVSFAKALEVGYNKYQNPYHNSVHATDVTQTVHSIMLHTGIMHKFTDLEILAIFFSTSIHDYEHTGTTNHFHVETRSETALLYNDKSVLENHHVSAAYHLMENADMNILASLTKDEWRELRRLVIMMVLSTDMSYHFQQMNSVKHCLRYLRQMEREHKDKIMSMIVHVADISHPAKPWVLHEQWARALMEEFFKQGDREAALGLQISSLCDRQTTNIAESQIGFIDVIVKPIFALLLEALNIIVAPLIQAAAKSQCVSSSKSSRRKTSTGVRKDEKKENPNRPKVEHPTCSERQLLATLKKPSFREHLMLNIQANRNKWKESQVTTAKEELVDNQSSWRTAAERNIHSNIQEMRSMVPKSKPLSPNESDDVIIEEFIPDDPQPMLTTTLAGRSRRVAAGGSSQHLPAAPTPGAAGGVSRSERRAIRAARQSSLALSFRARAAQQHRWPGSAMARQWGSAFPPSVTCSRLHSLLGRTRCPVCRPLPSPAAALALPRQPGVGGRAGVGRWPFPGPDWKRNAHGVGKGTGRSASAAAPPPRQVPPLPTLASAMPRCAPPSPLCRVTERTSGAPLASKDRRLE